MFDSHFHLNYFSVSEIDFLIQGALDSKVQGGLVAGVWNSDTETHAKWSQNSIHPQLHYQLRSNFVTAAERTPQGGRTSEFTGQESFRVFVSHGLHPMEIHARWLNTDGLFQSKQFEEDIKNFEMLLATHSDLIWALGETGFDVSQDVLKHPHCAHLSKAKILEVQELGFSVCVRASIQAQLPLIIHSRSAHEHTYKAIERALKAGVPRIMIHCYGGSAMDLKHLAESGVYVSFGGVVTWPLAKRMKESVVACPKGILLIETDAPDLSPVHDDGTRPNRNFPSEARFIAEKIAQLRGEKADDLMKAADDNLFRFLGVPKNAM